MKLGFFLGKKWENRWEKMLRLGKSRWLPIGLDTRRRIDDATGGKRVLTLVCLCVCVCFSPWQCVRTLKTCNHFLSRPIPRGC